MSWRLGRPQGGHQGGVRPPSPGANRVNREQAQAEGMAMAERDMQQRRDKTARLKKLRQERDLASAAESPPAPPARARRAKKPADQTAK